MNIKMQTEEKEIQKELKRIYKILKYKYNVSDLDLDRMWLLHFLHNKITLEKINK